MSGNICVIFKWLDISKISDSFSLENIGYTYVHNIYRYRNTHINGGHIYIYIYIYMSDKRKTA